MTTMLFALPDAPSCGDEPIDCGALVAVGTISGVFWGALLGYLVEAIPY